MKDIAKRLNMSVSTVSKALSNDASISKFPKTEYINRPRNGTIFPMNQPLILN